MKIRLFLSLAFILTCAFICHSKQMRFVEYTGFDEKAVASQVWDLGKLSVEDCRATAWVRLQPSGGYSECLGDVTNHYLLAGDTLYFRGYNEGRELSALVQNTDILCTFPLNDGYSSTNSFEIAVSDINGPRGNEFATCDITIKRGRFIAAACDTIDAVMLDEHRYGYRISVTNDSLSFDQHFYRWFSDSQKIPFALQINDGMGRSALFYDNAFSGAETQEQSKAETLRKTIENAVIDVCNGYVAISVSGITEGVILDTYIVDIPGNIYGYRSERYSDGDVKIRIPTDGLRHGQYMVVISAEVTEPIIEKRIVVL